ncbi:hypothetical protein [Vibrio lentus]|uniref:hypothetical protein n=1 Tax=Vibrio lentus TaxID=136468 RepID=UPI001056A656|nr:hypothetical protein [Vibrio lentus]
MNVKEKELVLLEDCLDLIRKEKTKNDKTFTTFFFASIILYATADLSASVKLALFGLELKSLYAVFVLYLLSLVYLNATIVNTIRENLLFDKYRKLLKELYSEVPGSLELIRCSDATLMDKVLVGKFWGKINSAFKVVTIIPFLYAYYKMAEELVSINDHNKLTFIISFFIFVYGIYSIILLFRAIYIQWLNDKAYENEAKATETST